MRQPGRGRGRCWAAAAWVALGFAWPRAPDALGQDSGGNRPGALLEAPSLGPIPGGGDSGFGRTPGAIQGDVTSPDNGIIGSRRASGRIPRKKGKAAASPTLTGPSALAVSAPLAMRETAAPSRVQLPLALPEEVEDEGSPTGMSLDEAVERMMRDNLDMLALKYELNQADADIITAGLRANPLIFGDAQFIPYQGFNTNRPYGPSQYDFSITYPLDISRKRKARVRVAEAARCTLESQFQDVVRRQIGNLYRAFVDLQAARLAYLTAKTSVEQQERVIADAERRDRDDVKAGDTLARLTLQLEKTRGALEDAVGNLDDAREAVGVLLSMPPEEAAVLEPRGRLRVAAPSPPPLETLIQLGLESRADLVAARRGVGRADAEVALARASRLDDWFLFYDPISYQDNSPSRLISSKSWDIGLTIPFPLFNRNQGGIARARANFTQTQIELAALQRRLVSEIRLAYREYRNSRSALERIDTNILPEARRGRAEAEADFAAGRITADDYFGHLDDDADTARSYRDAVVRHRRSMLDLNTALGVRLLP